MNVQRLKNTQEEQNYFRKIRGAPAPEIKDWHCQVTRRLDHIGVYEDFNFYVPDYAVPLDHTKEGTTDTFVFISNVRDHTMFIDGQVGEVRERYTFVVEVPDWLPIGESLTVAPKVETVIDPIPDLPIQ